MPKFHFDYQNYINYSKKLYMLYFDFENNIKKKKKLLKSV